MCAMDKMVPFLYEFSGETNELARGETPKSKNVLLSNEWQKRHFFCSIL